jgi:hypothetical protein
MPTLMQKIRLALRVWKRRREEADRAFVAKNTGWATPAAAPSAAPARTLPKTEVSAVDLDGLQVAYLDDSGQIDYYLDSNSGDVVEVRDSARGDAMPGSFRRVPRRSQESEREDRKAFLATIESAAIRGKLGAVVHDAAAFRKALAEDRSAERSWYNFKNDRANAAIETWLNSGK